MIFFDHSFFFFLVPVLPLLLILEWFDFFYPSYFQVFFDIHFCICLFFNSILWFLLHYLDSWMVFLWDYSHFPGSLERNNGPEADLIGYVEDPLLDFLVDRRGRLNECLWMIEEQLREMDLKKEKKERKKRGRGREPLLASSTFWAVFAEASMKINPFSLANCSPSSALTALLWARSHLFPISMIVMLGFACCLASSSQLARWLKVSLLRNQDEEHDPITLPLRNFPTPEKKRWAAGTWLL